jgi:hypothetical protein
MYLKMAVELVYKMKNQKGLAILMHGMSTKSDS